MSTLPVQSGYDAWAHSYDTVDNPTRDLAAADLRRQPFALHGAAVLELGCGTGLNTEWLIEGGAEVTGLEFSEGMLDKARKRLPGVRLLQHDITKPFPAPGAAFDLVVETLVLEHIGDLAPVFRETARVLKPGGLFFISELHPARQLAGKQARFADAAGQERKIAACLHTFSEYVNTAHDSGLRLLRAGEPGEDLPPRVLTLTFERGAG
jgi:malonyl-CoA O-methyltransferase